MVAAVIFTPAAASFWFVESPSNKFPLVSVVQDCSLFFFFKSHSSNSFISTFTLVCCFVSLLLSAVTCFLTLLEAGCHSDWKVLSWDWTEPEPVCLFPIAHIHFLRVTYWSRPVSLRCGEKQPPAPLCRQLLLWWVNTVCCQSNDCKCLIIYYYIYKNQISQI